MRRIKLKEAKSSIIYEMNEQYNNELESVHIYEQLSHKANFLGFNGLAYYFHEAGEEENEHAEKFAKIIYDLESEPIINLNISNIYAPADFKGLLDAALNHEKKITSDIQNLLMKAKETDDFITENFLLGFMKEQIEEESKINKIVSRVELLSDDNPNYLSIDRELEEEMEEEMEEEED